MRGNVERNFGTFQKEPTALSPARNSGQGSGRGDARLCVGEEKSSHGRDNTFAKPVNSMGVLRNCRRCKSARVVPKKSA